MVDAIRGMLSSVLSDQVEKDQIEKIAHLVLKEADAIAKTPHQTKKGNQKLRAAGAAAAQSVVDPAMDAKDLEIKVLKGGTVTPGDVTQAAPAAAKRKSSSGQKRSANPTPSSSTQRKAPR